MSIWDSACPVKSKPSCFMRIFAEVGDTLNTFDTCFARISSSSSDITRLKLEQTIRTVGFGIEIAALKYLA